MNICVKKNDIVETKIYLWEEKGDIQATSSESEVPKEVKPTIMPLTFRRARYQDTSKILQAANIGGTVNPVAFQEALVRVLLSSYLDEEGKKVESTTEIVNSLHPNVARAIASSYLEVATV